MQSTATTSQPVGQFISDVNSAIHATAAPVSIFGPATHAPSLLTVEIHQDLSIRAGSAMQRQLSQGLRDTAERLERLADEVEPTKSWLPLRRQLAALTAKGGAS